MSSPPTVTALSDGHLVVPMSAAVNNDTLHELKRDVLSHVAASEGYTELEYKTFAGGAGMASPYRFTHICTEKVWEIAWTITSAIEECLGDDRPGHLRPSRVGYNVYLPGDYIGLHVDQPNCEVALLVSLVGNHDPLSVYPSLRGMASSELIETAKASDGFPPGFRPVDFCDAAVLLDGRVLPHARPPVTEPTMLATFCFSALHSIED